MLVMKYTPNIFHATSVYVCAPHPSKNIVTLKWLCRENENNYS